MGLFYFLFGVLAGIALIALLPFLLALFGVALAIGLFLALPLIVAVALMIGLLAMTPAFVYGLAIAALLVALWASERHRLPPASPGDRYR